MKAAKEQFKELGFAKVDLSRQRRQGFPEVIFGEGKTPAQILRIAREIDRRSGRVLVTRTTAAVARQLRREIPRTRWHEAARCITVERTPAVAGVGKIAVVCAGTSDLPVAEEAAVTARVMGNEVESVYDVGVAGLHRLMARMEVIRSCRVIIVVAGMEGALPSVVGGLVDKPLIAVPTSVGYGANFKGLSALLTMINSCASGVTVVNIDNGFGAAYAASQINHLT
ncbi:MAG: nickel pincer cofactor biosynthesis protein LarB [Verrucomicrobiae bacterium]|nr:nickel pincer cofactor biosynthesis protein LarB [Verrucomicrobiae bacterium]